MRLIALYEVARKIWTSIVLSKIQLTLMRHNIVNKSQNGFHDERAGDTGLLQLINVIEEAIELNTPPYFTLWDLKAAIDSPSKNPLRLSWTRLGIPDDIVNWLVEIDIGGKSYIKSPLAVHNAYSSPAYLFTATDTEYF
jgi:hypothetical protein